MPPKDFVQPRRGTAAEWAAKTPSPVLKLGELGVETDTHRMKIGDGVTAWSSLGYIAGTFDLENVPVQVARDTTANLTALTDPFLSGQIVLDTDTGATKIGDGSSLWAALPDLRTPQSNTIIIAASDVSTSLKAKADYACDGTNDASVFQNALAALPQRGTIKAVGTFQIKSEIILGRYINIDLSEAYLDNSENLGYCFRLTRGTSYANNVSIKGGVIAGGFGGICLYSAKNCYFSDISISNCEIGLDVDGYNYGTWYNSFRNININSCSDKGIHIHTSGSTATTSFCMFGGSVKGCNYGVYANSGNGHTLHGVDIESNSTYDIYSSCYIALYGCRIENNAIASVYADTNGYIFIFEGRQTGAYFAGETANIHTINVVGSASFLDVSCRKIGNIRYITNESLQECIDSLSGGEIVILMDATYNESITFPHSLANVTFIGLGGFASNTVTRGTVINGGSTGPAIQFLETSSGSVKFVGITFTNDSAISNPIINVNSGGNWYLYFENCKVDSLNKNVIYSYHSSMRHEISFYKCVINGGILTGATTSEGGIKVFTIESCTLNSGSLDIGLDFQRSSKIIVRNNNISGTGTKSIRISSSIVSAIVMDNVVNAPILNSCSSAIIKNNPGYVTESTGTATITALSTSVTISHGLVSTPTRYSVTPSANIGNCWIDTPTSTQMTIHCSTAPEADTAVSWSAQVV